MSDAELRIGEVATRAGVSIDALRYYERRGLLGRARRSSGGFRLFALEAVERVFFIKQAQELGFSLDEIKGLLETGGAEECKRVRDLLQGKLIELDTKMKAMKAFRRILTRYLLECQRELEEHGEASCCPILPVSKHEAMKKAGD
jgi:DNA-binding transcriptional MerR regulator